MKVAAFALAALTLSAAELNGPAPTPVIAHEWGTFTSIAGDDGNPVAWAPLFGAPDLPCFVARSDGGLGKWQISGLVRMETPVLYFYAQHPVSLDVHVDFPAGMITEWFPRASKVMPAKLADPPWNGHIEWNGVSVLPGAKLEFPTSLGPSRYYAARATDSAPLRIGTQQEKLIFYRGVGSFPPPLRPRYGSDDMLEVRNAGADPVPLAILFDNHAGSVGYRTVRAIQDSVSLDPRTLTGDLDHLRQDLTADLVEFGLYPKEAAAMVETWRDTWFEEGTRVLYIMPRHEVDSVLPLSVTPAPAETTRVFVGRVEVLSPATRQMLQDAVDRADSLPLQRFGRFLGPFSDRLKLSGAAVDAARAALEKAGAQSCIR